MKYADVLESYTIIDDPDVIAIESFISYALESENSEANSDARELKTNLNKLVRAKKSGDKSEFKKAKDDVDDSIKDVNDAANKEKDLKKKARLRKIAKIGGIIAGSLATAATVAVVAKKLKDKKDARDKASAEVAARIDRNNEILRRQNEEIRRDLADLEGRGENLARNFTEKGARLRESALAKSNEDGQEIAKKLDELNSQLDALLSE